MRGNHDDSSLCANNTFLPVFPASCPYVTSVGSTLGFAPEKAINFTGGGFSNVFPSPYYQTAAVAGFLETIPSDFAGIFNSTGRGYPDVATQGWNFEIVVDGQVFLEGGTSASAPTFASIIALINDRLVAAGKPVLGFLNPFLYSTASSTFTDITSGHNSGNVCPASSVSPGYHFMRVPRSRPIRWPSMQRLAGTPSVSDHACFHAIDISHKISRLWNTGFPRPPGRRIGIVVPVRNSMYVLHSFHHGTMYIRTYHFSPPNTHFAALVDCMNQLSRAAKLELQLRTDPMMRTSANTRRVQYFEHPIADFRLERDIIIPEKTHRYIGLKC